MKSVFHAPLIHRVALASLALTILLPFNAGYAQDSGSASKDRTAAGESEAVVRHIASHSQSGVFAIYDPRQNAPLALELVEVHTGAHPVESGETYYCADFRDADGVLYDLDFYVDESRSEPVVVETFIHKVGKKDRIRPAKNDQPANEAVASKVRQTISEAWQEPVQTMFDPRTGQATEFTFEAVHDTVKPVGDGGYYACVDARDAEGILYDLDTYVVTRADGSFEVAETIIHKKDGVERLRPKSK